MIKITHIWTTSLEFTTQVSAETLVTQVARIVKIENCIIIIC